MMEFLEKLYSQEYFAPVLFTVIAILAVLFIIVLILALRDAKKRKQIEGGTNDAFAKVSEEPQDISVTVPATENNEIKEEVPVEQNVINSVEPTSNGFEDIEVPAPVVADNETPIVNEQSEVTITPTVEPQDIKIEDKAEDDLNAIASTLLNEYKSETEQPKEFSAVGVKPDTIAPANNASDMPNLGDIPVPQPVRVTETSTVIDSSKQNVDSIQTEEYNINK